MARGKNSWTFRDVQTFLLSHSFVLHHVRGSHYYFRSFHSGKLWMAHVQYHGRTAIHPKTLSSVIKQSGLSKEEWLRGL